jgi:hypothetical protein
MSARTCVGTWNREHGRLWREMREKVTGKRIVYGSLMDARLSFLPPLVFLFPFLSFLLDFIFLFF